MALGVRVDGNAGSVAAVMADGKALDDAAHRVLRMVRGNAMSSVDTGAFLKSIKITKGGKIVKSRAGAMYDRYVTSFDPAAYNIEFGRLVKTDGMWRYEGGHRHFSNAYMRL